MSLNQNPWIDDLLSSFTSETSPSSPAPAWDSPDTNLSHLQTDHSTPLPPHLDTSPELHPHPSPWHEHLSTLHSPSSAGTTTTGNQPSSDDSNPFAQDWTDALSPHHHYNPHHPPAAIVLGNPAAEMSHWHLQQTPDSCGISAQQSAIESLNHQHLSETQLRHEAEVHGWYAPHIGTPAEDFGKLIEQHTGVSVQHHYGGTIAEIENHLVHGEKVFVGVNSTVEWLPDQHSALGQAAPNLFDPSHYTGKPADHIVQVVGVEINPLDPHQSNVIINDSGTPNGRGVEIPVDQFQQAMDASHGFVTSTVTQNAPLQSIQPQPSETEIMFGRSVHHYHHLVRSRGYDNQSGDSGSSSSDNYYSEYPDSDSCSDTDGDGDCDCD